MASRIDATPPHVWAACTLAVLLALLAGSAWWSSQRADQKIEKIEGPVNGDPALIRENLAKQIRARVAGDIARLDPLRDWYKVRELEVMGEQQLGDLDRFMEGLAKAFAQKEASETLALASRILTEQGIAEALRLLESKSGAREAALDALNGRDAANDLQRRKLLRENLLKASLLEKDFQFDEAEAEYRAVVHRAHGWAEPSNVLASVLIQRGNIMDPGVGNQKLQEAAELCRATLRGTSRESAPQDWAWAQTHLGRALELRGTRLGGRDARRMLAEAGAAYRAALEVFTRKQSPREWAMTQNNLGNALTFHGARRGGEEGQRLLCEAASAYRAALEIYTRKHFPQPWAQTMRNLASTLGTLAVQVPIANSASLRAQADRLQDEVAAFEKQ